jgi:hypothetical protein
MQNGKVVWLVSGLPHAGKSHLAKKLKRDHRFSKVSVDATYVAFIQTRCPELYFEALNQCISLHYDCLLKNGDFQRLRLRNYVADWQCYLVSRVRSAASVCDRLVVEGYLLKDCVCELKKQLEGIAEVRSIEAVDQRYRVEDQCLLLEELLQQMLH